MNASHHDFVLYKYVHVPLNSALVFLAIIITYLSSYIMCAFGTFDENDIYTHLRHWRETGVTSLQISCGPLVIFASYDFNDALWKVHGIRRGQIMSGSVRFYSPRYTLFRCIYGIIRTQGLECPHWEYADSHSCRHLNEYMNLISQYLPYMRMKMQYRSDEAIYVQNLLTHSYMKIIPVRGGAEEIHPESTNATHAEQSEMDEQAYLSLPTALALGMNLGFVSDDTD